MHKDYLATFVHAAAGLGHGLAIGDREIDITFSCLPSSEEMTKTQQQSRGERYSIQLGEQKTK
jgi:hypothetical protein